MPLRGRISQQVGWVIGGHQSGATKGVNLSSESAYRCPDLQEGLGRGQAEATNHLRLQDRKLSHQEGRTGGDLIFLGRAVARRPAFDHVADVDLVPTHLYGFDHPGQQLPRPSNEGKTLPVLFNTGSLADKNQSGLWVAGSEHDVGAVLTQLAPLAVPQVITDLFQGRISHAYRAGLGEQGRLS